MSSAKYSSSRTKSPSKRSVSSKTRKQIRKRQRRVKFNSPKNEIKNYSLNS